MPFLIILLVVAIWLIATNIRIVPEKQVFVIERLGAYHMSWGAGLHLKMPFIDRVVKKVSMKEQVLDFPPQPVITKDNVTMNIDSVVFLRVMDAKLFTYGVANPIAGVESLAATTLRNLVGSMDFDETLTSRDNVNTQMQAMLDEATDPWGIKVIRVEVKNIMPPADIQDAMTKQMKAEREKRQALLEAEAHQQSVILRAEGDKKAKILAAEAERDARIALAEGEARSIELVYQAEADGLRKLAETELSEGVLKLKGYEALKDVANGNATKVFMPTDLASIVSGMGVMGDAWQIGQTEPAKKPTPAPKHRKDPCLDEESSHISHGAARANANTRRDLAGRDGFANNRPN